MCVPEQRIRILNDAPVNPDGECVVYWMVAFRRLHWNFALQRAVELARELGKPLTILEGLRCDYRWASDRFHRFVIEGMRDNAATLADTPVLYYPYVEPRRGAGKGMLAELSKKACAVITDEFPAFHTPRMTSAAGPKLLVRLESIDSNGLLPLRAADRVYPTAYSFRRFLQKNLRPHFEEFPEASPLEGLDLPTIDVITGVPMRWPATDLGTDAVDRLIAKLPIDHEVRPTTAFRGGHTAAHELLHTFLDQKLERYNEDRNHPDREGGSTLSGHLHFGMISAHEIFSELMRREGWTPDQISGDCRGSRSGWWNVGESAEALLDQLVTWRELGFNICWQQQNYADYDSLPDWARRTLKEHEDDEREYVYTLEEFERAETHDELWNAAQRQLVREGSLHNYLRMLWGKKILEWTATPRDAMQVMVELNNKYALDGRDPNSYSGIFWCLGRYDRAWGPERPIFGKIRFMSSKNTRRKVELKRYLERYAASSQPRLI